jgi:thioredoxin reductase (NADPH)
MTKVDAYELESLDAYEKGNRSATAEDVSRPQHVLETSRPGIFAVGDVRSDSVKRVASAVGEGSIVVSAVHRALSAS